MRTLSRLPIVLFCGLLVLAASARAEDAAPPNLFPVCQNAKCGYIDRSGQVVIPLEFDQVSPFADGVAHVRLGCHDAYIDAAGTVVLKLACGQFNTVNAFSEGMAVVGNQGTGEANGDTLGFIDKSGKLVVPLQYADAQPFSNGMAMVSVRGARGYIDHAGNFVIQPRYDMAQSFSEGLARVGFYVKGIPKEHFIDRTGRRVIQSDYRSIDDFHEGLARVWVGKRKGFIDRTGKVVIKPTPFDAVDAFSDGMARVQMGGAMGQGGKLGFIDRSGKIVIKPRYQLTGNFSEGLCAVAVDGRYGYIDKSGTVVIPPTYATASSFRGGLAQVQTGDTVGYIDKTGTYVWQAVEGRSSATP